jgi:phage antirepressor YoqD-like protein
MAPVPQLTGKELIAAALIEAQSTIMGYEAQLAIAAPKAEFFDEFVDSDNWFDVRDAAQMLRNSGVDTGEKRLFRWMRENKWLDNKSRPLQTRLTQGLLDLKLSDYVVGYRDGKPRYGDPQVMVTPKGLERLRRELSATVQQGMIEAVPQKMERKTLNPETKLSLVGSSRKAV